MEYQPLPPVSTMQQLSGGGGNNQNHAPMNQNTLQLNSMQPPLLPLSMPLQVVHNLQQLNNNNINTTNNNTILTNNNNSNNNSQNLPPPSQLLQAIHQTNNGGNGGNGPPNNNPNPNNPPNNGAGTDDQGNRWTQYQVQQLWRQHHAYLNGNVANIVNYVKRYNNAENI